MSRTYRKTPSISESPRRKKMHKRIAKRDIRRAIKNGVEMSNGGEYRYHVKDRWDYVDYCKSSRADSLACWIDMKYEYYVHDVHSYQEWLWYYEKAKKVDISDKSFEYYTNEYEKFDYDRAYEDWSSNSAELKKKYKNVFEYLRKRKYELERILSSMKHCKRMLAKKPTCPVWDREEVEQEYKKYYIYK